MAGALAGAGCPVRSGELVGRGAGRRAGGPPEARAARWSAGRRQRQRVGGSAAHGTARRGAERSRAEPGRAHRRTARGAGLLARRGGPPADPQRSRLTIQSVVGVVVRAVLAVAIQRVAHDEATPQAFVVGVAPVAYSVENRQNSWRQGGGG